jgi:hypothetical protein
MKRMRRFVAILALYLGLESLYAPPAQLSARGADLAIAAYQETLSGVARDWGARCRYKPSCSEYGRQALSRYGFLAGTAKTAARVARCGPWGPAPGSDPP